MDRLKLQPVSKSFLFRVVIDFAKSYSDSIKGEYTLEQKQHDETLINQFKREFIFKAMMVVQNTRFSTFFPKNKLREI